MGPARSLPGAGNGRFSVATAAASWASARGEGIGGVLAGFQVSLPTDLILFGTFLSFFFSSSGGEGVEEGGRTVGRFHAVRSGQHAGSRPRPEWRGPGTGPSPRAGVSHHRVPVLLRDGGGGGFRRERVVQPRWSHSRPVRSWLRPGLAGPFEPTRAGNSAGGSPRTPELGLHGRTKASQIRLLDAKFENKANLEKPRVPVLAKPRKELRLWGVTPSIRGRIFGVRVL